jgi:hypothetical protein
MMSRKRILVLCGLIAIAIFALGYPPGREFFPMRPPNAHETFYQYIAFEFDAPGLCAKVSPSATLPGGFFIAASYARSDCYAKLARRYDRPTLCWSARRLGSFSLLSEQTSRLSCFWDVWHRAPDPSLSTYMLGREDLVAIFTEMGYQPEELYREGVTPPLLSLRDAYARLAQQPDLVSRIARVTAVSASDRSVGPPAPSTAVGGASTPHSGNGLFPISASPSGVPTAAERDRLDELAAHVSGDVSWCTRIPADVLDPGTARELGRPSLFQRDRCVLEVASNTRRPASCRLIPERPDDWSGAMSRRSVCEFQAARPPDTYHYGAPPPSSEDEARALITLLGYPTPNVRDISANEIQTDYFQFIWQLASGQAATHTRTLANRRTASDAGAARSLGAGDGSAMVAAARARFLARTPALPNYP